ncbi:MAG: hypothetical protein KF812_08930 [Fimbriimonadaceae bacterium]|nr:hypothetical protein [Fimbriimonadaceae bacterium]
MVTFIAALVLMTVPSSAHTIVESSLLQSNPASNYSGKFGLGIGRLRGDYTIDIYLQDSGNPNQSTVTGRATKPGSAQIEFRGTYYKATNKIKAFGEVRGAENAFSINLDGFWAESTDVLGMKLKATEIATGDSGDTVEFYLHPGQANQNTSLNVLVMPTRTQFGQDIGGQAAIKVSGLKNPGKLEIRGYVSYLFNQTTISNNAGTRVSIDCPQDGEYRVDLSQLGINLPAGGDDPKCVVIASLGELFITGSAPVDVVSARESLSIGFLTTFGSGRGVVGVKGRFGLNYSVINASSQPNSTKITERLQFGPEGGMKSTLPETQWEAAVSGSSRIPRSETANHFVELDFPRPGRYRLDYEISGPGLATVQGFVTYDVSPPPPANQPIRKGDIRGTIEIDNGSPTEGEPVRVRFSHSVSGIASASVREEITAIGPNGAVLASSSSSGTLSEGTTYAPSWVFNGREAGNYRIVAKVTGETVQPFQTEATVRVAPRPNENAGGGGVTTGGAGQTAEGTYGLVKKELGTLEASPIIEPYGTWNGSGTANSIQVTWTATRDYEGTFTFQGTWDTPPPVLKPGQILELKVSARASRTSENLPYHGGNAQWVVEGGEVLERGNSFAGLASNGQFYGSTDTTLRLKIGTGGRIVITANAYVKTGGNLCTYTYEWNAPPTVETEEEDVDPFADSRTGLFPLDSDLPGADEESAKIEARLEPAAITLRAGGMSEIVNVYVSGFRKRTDDRVTITFPQKTDGWASLPGGIVVTGGDGSYWPPNMGRPEHSDGFFFRARDNAPTGTQVIDVVVSQQGAGTVVLKLTVNVIGRQSPSTGNTGTSGLWQGEWNTNLDTLSLTQNGNQVSGQFGVDRSRVSGTANGNVVNLTVFIGNEEFGTAKLTLSADGRSFTGEIALKGSSDRIEWSGTKK